jgi:hypothetical protein
MKNTNEQRQRWVANALARAAALPNSAERDLLFQIAREHLLAIVQEYSHKPVTERLTVLPSGLW